MYGRLIACTRVPACKSSALAIALPNPGQEARLHYMCGLGWDVPRNQINSQRWRRKCGKNGRKRIFFYWRAHFRNPFIYRIRERNALATDYVCFINRFINKKIFGFLEVKFKNRWNRLSSFRLKILNYGKYFKL